MVFGGIMFMVGLMIILSHFAAPAADGNQTTHYVVAGMAMLFGGIRVGWGIVKLKQSKNS
jgi:hypothetical protein